MSGLSSATSPLYDAVALACMASVTLYVLWHMGTSVLDRVTASSGRRKKPAARAAVAAPNNDEQHATEEEEAGAEAPEVVEDQADPVGALLTVIWPEGARQWAERPALRLVRRALPSLVVLAVALYLTYSLFGGAGHVPALDGSGEHAGHALGAAQDTNRVQWSAGVPYVSQTFMANGQPHELPIVDCAHYPEAARLQEKVLGPAAAAGTGGKPATPAASRADPEYEARLVQERRQQQELRRKAARRCILRDASMLDLEPAATATTEAWEARWISKAALVAQAVRERQQRPGEGAVRDVLVARNGTRYYRVQTMRIGSGSALPEPAIISEEALLGAVRRWHQRFLKLSPRLNALIYPCVCAPHLGLLYAGAHFHYIPPAPGTAAMGTWELLLDVHIQHEVVDAMDTLGDPGSAIAYSEYRTPFPGDADAPFNVTFVSHGVAADVAFVAPAALLDAPTGPALINDAEPMWVMDPALLSAAAVSEPLPAAPVSPFATVVPLKHVAPFAQGRRFQGEPLACLQHCLALEARRPSSSGG